MKRLTVSDLMIAVPNDISRTLKETGKARLAAGQWQLHQILAVDVKQVEDEIDKSAPAAPIGGVLDQSEGRDTVRTHPAELAVQVSLSGRVRSEAAIAGYLSVQSSPVRVSSRTSARSIRACMRYPSN
jgi:hypothetical protein